MAAKPKETIWTDKKIPPMEYMPIERASAILNCEKDDFWHWHEIGAIKLATKAMGGKVSGWARPKRVSDKEAIAEEMKLNTNSEIKDLCRNLSITIDEINNVETRSSQKEIEFKGDVLGGVWFFSADDRGTKLRDKVRTDALMYAQLRGKKADYVIYMEGEEEIEIKEGSILILKRDIERLYDSICTGETILPEGIFGFGVMGAMPEDTTSGIRPGRLGEFLQALFYLAPDIGGDALSQTANRRQAIIEAAFSKAREDIPSFNFQPPSQTIVTKYLNV